MGAAEAVVADARHAAAVAARMRPADRDEVLASDGLTPAQAVAASMEGSDFARALLIGGELVAIFGVRSLTGCAVPWALTTDTVERHRIAFWRTSKYVLGKLAESYPLLVQCIDARHTQALRWVRCLGFQIEHPHPCGPLGMPFHQVTFRAGREGG